MLTPEQIMSVYGENRLIPSNYEREKVQMACDLANIKHPQEDSAILNNLRLLYAAHVLMVFQASDLAIAKLAEEILKNGVIPSLLQSQVEESLATTPYGQLYLSVRKSALLALSVNHDVPILGILA